MRRTGVGVLGLGLLVSTSCRTVEAPRSARSSAETNVHVEGGTVVEAVGPSASSFLTLAAHVSSRCGLLALDRLVRLYPDRCLLALRQGDGGALRERLLESYVQQHGSGEGAGQVFRDGELARTRGDAKMVRIALDRAREEGCLHWVFTVRLEELEHQVLIGKTDDLEEAWSGAVRSGATVDDPTAWRLAMQLRPVSASWPVDVFPDGERDVLERLLRLEVARGNDSQALLDAVRLETLLPDDSDRGAQVRLQHARILMRLGRSGESLALASKLADEERDAVAASALALEGVLYAGFDDLAGAAQALDAALRRGGTWPGMARARSDLGIVELRAGHSQRGLALLEESEREFAAAGDAEGQARALRNRARFHRSRGEAALSKPLFALFDELVRREGLLLER